MTASNFISTRSAIFDQDTDSYRLILPEDAGVGTVVGSIGRSGRDGTVTYSLRGRDSGLLQIDSAGQITLVGESPSGATELQVDIIASIARSGAGGADGADGQGRPESPTGQSQDQPEILTATGSRIIVMADDDLPLVQIRPRDGAVPENQGYAFVAGLTVLHPSYSTIRMILHGEHAGLMWVFGDEIRLGWTHNGFDYEIHGSSTDLTLTFLTGLPAYSARGLPFQVGDSSLESLSSLVGSNRRLDVPFTVSVGDDDEPPVFFRQAPVPGWPADEPLPDYLQRYGVLLHDRGRTGPNHRRGCHS